jgi:regulatory protein
MPSAEFQKLEQRAKNVLLHQLSRSMKTRHQLAQVLKKREIPDDIASSALDRFQEAQLIDDKVFAEAFVRSRVSLGKGKSVIRRELRSKGVAPEIIEQATMELSQEKEQLIADELAVNRLSRMQGLDSKTIERRIIGFLQRRGFNNQVAISALRKALSER